MKQFEFLKNIKITPKKIIFWSLPVILAIIAFVVINNLTQCWTFTKLPGIAPDKCGQAHTNTQPEFNEQGTPAANLPPTPVLVPESNLPPAWDGASRINILFIGLDERDLMADQGPPRSDTMILFTIDPITKTAGMLSIPRDLWVNIPGFGYSRINTAYASGEGSQLPGGGPGLAMKTVEQLLGVPVHYYAQVDFTTFTDLINIIGCIYLVPTERLVLDPIGPGMDKVVITPGGERKLCGWQVLAYARIRKTEGGDSDRSRRQQQVIFAIRDQVFKPDVFPSLIARAPEIYATLSSGIKTNMPLEDALKLAVLGKDIDPATIKTGVIDPTLGMAIFDNTTLNGQPASIMKPIMDKIRILRDEIFTTSGPTSPLAQGDAATLMRDEAARVRVLDGTFTGLDQRAGALFQSYGMGVTELGTAPESYSQTVVIVYGPKLYTVKWLQATFGLSARQIRFAPDPNQTVDIEIRLGSDIAPAIP
ncbi:MAG: LytR family transcriptional protein [Chloroflexi bacterium OLB14]|nr:MAG: LytR family transcriptional protein [Chloroflexi bacterium OLB14]